VRRRLPKEHLGHEGTARTHAPMRTECWKDR
jgi:hypothetical protein